MEHESDDDRPLLRSTRLPPATAALRTSADDSTARARELREALDELRAELDGTAGRAKTSGEPPAGPPPASLPASLPASQPAPPVELPADPAAPTPGAAPTAARRARMAAVAVAGVAAMILAGTAVVRVVAWSMAAARQGSPVAASPTPGPSGNATAGGASPAAPPPASPSLPSPGPVGPPLALPGGMPVSGPGADAPGADALAVVAAEGAVDVWERLVTRPGTTSVRLESAPTSALPGTAGAEPAQLQVALDGRRVTPRRDGSGWQVALPDGGSFTQVVVRYRLTGALVRTAPAPPGRVTLVLRPVTGPAAVSADDPVVVRLTDPRVGAVYCPGARTPLCAVSRGSTHVATVPPGTAPVVLAQLTLG